MCNTRYLKDFTKTKRRFSFHCQITREEVYHLSIRFLELCFVVNHLSFHPANFACELISKGTKNLGQRSSFFNLLDDTLLIKSRMRILFFPFSLICYEIYYFLFSGLCKARNDLRLLPCGTPASWPEILLLITQKYIEDNSLWGLFDNFSLLETDINIGLRLFRLK